VIPKILEKLGFGNKKKKTGDVEVSQKANSDSVKQAFIIMNGSSVSDLNSQLWGVIGPGNTQEVRALLAKGTDPNFRGHLGRTAVHRACLFGCSEQFDMLIDAGGSADTTDEDGETPLHLAASKGHFSIVERLLKLGVDLQRRSDYGTPLDCAAFGGHVNVMATLLNNGATATTKNCWGRTPLHEAASHGHIEASRLLLRRGAEVDAVDRFGNDRTPLHEAIYPGSSGLVELLLLYDANVEHRNNWGATPLHMAARIGAADIVEVLLRAGADQDATDQQGRTPLDEALRYSHLEVVSLLETRSTRGRFPNQPQTQTDSPLNQELSCRHSPGPTLARYQEAMRVLREEITGEGYLSSQELDLQARVLKEARDDIGFRYQPDGQKRIERNKEAIQAVTGGTGYASAKEITSEVRVLALDHLLKLDRIKKQQDLAREMRWLSPDDDPLLVIFVSHRWEHPLSPDPFGTQLSSLKAMANMFLEIAIGLKEPRVQRLQRVPTLITHGALQAVYFVGAIAGFVDSFQGSKPELRRQLLRRVGIVYDFMSLPQNPCTTEEQSEFHRGMIAFRRLMASTPVVVLRYPDDEYSSRSWCELEFWSAGKQSRYSFSTTPVVRTDMWGKEIRVHELGPPSNYNSYSNFCEVLRALAAWERQDSVTADELAGTIMRNYHLAFSWREKVSDTPLLTRPDFNPHTQNNIWKGKALDDQENISAIPPSFRFWCSIRETLCHDGLDSEDFAEILKNHMKMHGIFCTEERDIVPTALWLLGCHELYEDYGFRVFYGRCLLRYFFEGKDLRVNLFFRLPNQQVHFKFADGEESLEG